MEETTTPVYRERLRCRLGFHQWTKWEHFRNADLTMIYKATQEVEIQQRACTYCGKHQRHVVTSL